MRRQLSYDEKLRLPLVIDYLLLGVSESVHYDFLKILPDATCP